jgi:hypothetical protein
MKKDLNDWRDRKSRPDLLQETIISIRSGALPQDCVFSTDRRFFLFTFFGLPENIF